MTRETVEAIKVGGEWHCVRDDDGKLKFSLSDLTEQCDSCGSSGGYSLWTSQPIYTCDRCGEGYPIEMHVEEEVVF